MTHKLESVITAFAAEPQYALSLFYLFRALIRRRDVSLLYVGTEDGYIIQFEFLVSPISGIPSLHMRHKMQHASFAICTIAVYGGMTAYASQKGYSHELDTLHKTLTLSKGNVCDRRGKADALSVGRAAQW